MVPFKKFFNKRNAKRLGLLASNKLEYAEEKGLDFEDYVAELFDKGLTRWAKVLSSEKRLKAAEASKNIKNLLKNMGYNVVPSQQYMKKRATTPSSYHSRWQDTEDSPVNKEIGLSRADFRNIAPEVNIEKYLRRLFVLAHEAGHALQYKGDIQRNRDLELGKQLAKSYLENNFDAENIDEEKLTPIIKHLALVFIELAAWSRAVEDLVPKELHPQMLSFAKRAYLTYMQSLPWGSYVKAPFINDALDALQYNIVESKRYGENVILEGSSLFPVPRKLMGVSTDINELPSYDPYGFWVDKSGNFIKTDSHLDTARDMIENANEWLVSQGKEPNTFRGHIGPYKVLFRNGWMRVISSTPTIYYEVIPGGEISPKQMEFLKTIKNLYGKREIKQDYYLDASDFVE